LNGDSIYEKFIKDASSLDIDKNARSSVKVPGKLFNVYIIRLAKSLTNKKVQSKLLLKERIHNQAIELCK